MGAVLLILILVASAALAVVGARGALTVVFHIMANPAPVRVRWGRVMFAGAIFWFWYLMPTLARALPLADVKSLFVP